jgi:hypothetical protein
LARTLHERGDMQQIHDALELLTAQHEEIDALVLVVHRDRRAADLRTLVDRVVAHLALEYELFFPEVATTLSHSILDEVERERRNIHRVLSELVWLGVDDPEFVVMFHDLVELVRGHAAWQEGDLFETLAETWPADSLAALGERLRSHETAAAAA